MIYTLPKLAYAYDSLQPAIDTQTMEIHHTKHHQKYIDELNKALQAHPELQQKSLEELLSNLHDIPEQVRTTIADNAGGHYSHSLFWNMMTPHSVELSDNSLVSTAIKNTFGSLQAMQQALQAIALKQFGSGWGWLCLTAEAELKLLATPNQTTPLEYGLRPLLGVDVWEHAYYLRYQNKRVDYLSAWWSVVNWHFVEDTYKHYITTL